MFIGKEWVPPLPTSEYTQYGSVSSVVGALFPETSLEIRQTVERVLVGIEDLCEKDNEGASAIVRGSGAKRLIGGTPPGWRMPSHIWNELVELYPSLATEPAVNRIKTGPHDLDVRVILAKEHTFDDLASRVRAILEGENHAQSYIEIHAFNGIRVLEVRFDNGFSLDLGLVASEENFQDDSRLSYYLPTKETFTVAFVRGREVYTDAASQWALQSADTAISGFSLFADISQAVISIERSVLSSYWWPPLPDKKSGGRRLEDVLVEPDFWKHVAERSQGREVITRLRQEEMKAGLLLLLTVDPMSIHTLRRYHLIDQTLLRKYSEELKNFYIDSNVYTHKFRNGTLTASESGPVILAGYLGLSSVEDLLPLLQVDR